MFLEQGSAIRIVVVVTIESKLAGIGATAIAIVCPLEYVHSVILMKIMLLIIDTSKLENEKYCFVHIKVKLLSSKSAVLIFSPIKNRTVERKSQSTVRTPRISKKYTTPHNTVYAREAVSTVRTPELHRKSTHC